MQVTEVCMKADQLDSTQSQVQNHDAITNPTKTKQGKSVELRSKKVTRPNLPLPNLAHSSLDF